MHSNVKSNKIKTEVTVKCSGWRQPLERTIPFYTGDVENKLFNNKHFCMFLLSVVDTTEKKSPVISSLFLIWGARITNLKKTELCLSNLVSWHSVGQQLSSWPPDDSTNLFCIVSDWVGFTLVADAVPLAEKSYTEHTVKRFISPSRDWRRNEKVAVSNTTRSWLKKAYHMSWASFCLHGSEGFARLCVF